MSERTSNRQSRRGNTVSSTRDADVNVNVNEPGLSSWSRNYKVVILMIMVGSWIILYLLKPSMVLKKNTDGTDAVDTEGNKVIDQQKLLLYALGIGGALSALYYGTQFC